MVDQVYDPEGRRGQLMERSTFVQSGELALEAILLRGEASPSLLIAPGRFAYGASMEGPIANELAYAAAYAGHANLRFAWRGHGASQGEPIPEGADHTPLLEDLAAAAELLRESGSARLALAAIRDGVEPLLAFAAEAPLIELVVLIDPPEDCIPAIGGVRVPVFCVFPGDEPLPEAFRDTEACQVKRIPKADRTFRRNLNLLGQVLAGLLGDRRRD